MLRDLMWLPRYQRNRPNLIWCWCHRQTYKRQLFTNCLLDGGLLPRSSSLMLLIPWTYFRSYWPGRFWGMSCEFLWSKFSSDSFIELSFFPNWWNPFSWRYWKQTKGKSNPRGRVQHESHISNSSVHNPWTLRIQRRLLKMACKWIADWENRAQTPSWRTSYPQSFWYLNEGPRWIP